MKQNAWFTYSITVQNNIIVVVYSMFMLCDWVSMLQTDDKDNTKIISECPMRPNGLLRHANIFATFPSQIFISRAKIPT